MNIKKVKRYPDARELNDKKFNYNSSIWRAVRQQALNRDSYTCVSCGDMATVVDHIIPIKRGGHPLEMYNLQSLCTKCHQSKSQTERKDR